MDNFTESSGISDTTSLNSSGAEADLPSPESMMNMKPRKLTFSPCTNENSNTMPEISIQQSSPQKMCISPPYRKVRALRYVVLNFLLRKDSLGASNFKNS